MISSALSTQHQSSALAAVNQSGIVTEVKKNRACDLTKDVAQWRKCMGKEIEDLSSKMRWHRLSVALRQVIPTAAIVSAVAPPLMFFGRLIARVCSEGRGGEILVFPLLLATAVVLGAGITASIFWNIFAQPKPIPELEQNPNLKKELNACYKDLGGGFFAKTEPQPFAKFIYKAITDGGLDCHLTAKELLALHSNYKRIFNSTGSDASILENERSQAIKSIEARQANDYRLKLLLNTQNEQADRLRAKVL